MYCQLVVCTSQLLLTRSSVLRLSLLQNNWGGIKLRGRGGGYPRCLRRVTCKFPRSDLTRLQRFSNCQSLPKYQFCQFYRLIYQSVSQKSLERFSRKSDLFIASRSITPAILVYLLLYCSATIAIFNTCESCDSCLIFLFSFLLHESEIFTENKNVQL